MVNKQKSMLMLSSVASMIDQFNVPNIELLIEMGYKVDVACNFKEGNTCSDEQIVRLKEKLQSMGVEYRQIDFARNAYRIDKDMIAYMQVLSLVKNKKYDFIHCHSPIGGVVARLVGKHTKTKIIYTAHGFHFYSGAPKKNWLIYYPIEKWLSKYTDVLITINRFDYNIAKKNFKAGRIEYCHGVGVDLNKYSAPTISKSEMRKKLGLANDDFVFLTVAELDDNKNQMVMLKALTKIENPKIKYILCGIGEYKELFEKFIKDHNLNNRVKLLGFRTDIPDVLGAVDAFVYPSYFEGLPVAIMEAMAANLRIIVGNARGNIDLIRDKRCWFEPFSVDELIKVVDFCTNHWDESIVDDNARHLQKFHIKHVIKEMEKIYKYAEEL